MLNKKIKLSLISDYRSSIMGVGALLIVIFHLWLSLFAKIESQLKVEQIVPNMFQQLKELSRTFVIVVLISSF